MIEQIIDVKTNYEKYKHSYILSGLYHIGNKFAYLYSQKCLCELRDKEFYLEREVYELKQAGKANCISDELLKEAYMNGIDDYHRINNFTYGEIYG